ncbi:hypothetical protein RchiOBHm_Chr1g0317431 [Rosa chinensis]|uniref:Uncharacterized protein n=1 Tax=Rosa chinensis TaxID=74649 RepID=A0A2P6S802_ROSCH|nr:hypothetical protein RchiOBHm_Chr1g0317431 [Rosa chinensis]
MVSGPAMQIKTLRSGCSRKDLRELALLSMLFDPYSGCQSLCRSSVKQFRCFSYGSEMCSLCNHTAAYQYFSSFLISLHLNLQLIGVPDQADQKDEVIRTVMDFEEF